MTGTYSCHTVGPLMEKPPHTHPLDKRALTPVKTSKPVSATGKESDKSPQRRANYRVSEVCGGRTQWSEVMIAGNVD